MNLPQIDALLVRSVLNGEERSLRELHHLVRDFVRFGVGRTRVVRQHIDDVTSVIIIHMLERDGHVLRCIEQAEHPRAYAYIVMHHCITRYLEGLRRRREVSIEGTDAPGPDDPDPLAIRDLRRMLASFMGGLSSRDAIILRQRYWMDLSHREIGHMLQMTPENVRVRVHRLLTDLREYLLERGVDSTFLV